MVLVIDDNDMDLMVIKRILTDRLPQVTILEASGGDEALQILRQQEVQARIRLVLVDIHLAGDSGLDIISAITQSPALDGVPVIAISGSDNPAWIRQAYRLGVRSFLVKPVDYAEYSDMVALAARYWLSMNMCVRDAIEQRARLGNAD